MIAALLDHCAAVQTAADGRALIQTLADGTTYGSFSFSQSPDFTSLLPVSMHCTCLTQSAPYTGHTDIYAEKVHGLEFC